MSYVIQGIQHMGIAVSDMDASLKLYRKLFGLDIPFADGLPLLGRDLCEAGKHGFKSSGRMCC